MSYTETALVTYFFIYSFLGWCMEVGVMALKERKFCNRGFLNAPLCMKYGIIMDILLVVFPTLMGHPVFQLFACMLVASAVEYISGEIAKHIIGSSLWNYDSRNIFGGEKKGLLFSLGIGAGIMVMMYLIHPVIFFLVQLLPNMLLTVLSIICLILLGMDMTSVLFVIHKRKNLIQVNQLETGIHNTKLQFGNRIYLLIWKRIQKAYPNMKTFHIEKANDCIFAKGLCFDKLIWVFLICALVGDIFETIYIWGVTGNWGSRSSVIYGPFSIVWGAGAVVLTMVLQRLVDKEDRYIFLGGFFLGGTYEYVCSVFTEVFLGTKFWDYSDMPFNIGGRTNLLFCIYWGILSLVWVKICYPRISSLIEKIPPITGKIITWIVIILMVCDMLISALAMVRYTERISQKQPSNMVETFLDYQYPDDLIEYVWPNMRVQ